MGMAKTINFRILGLFMFIIAAWGLAWPVNKIGLAYMSPLWYTAMRLIVGTITMLTVAVSFNKFTLPNRQDIPLILIIGLLQISAYIFLTNVGLAYLPAGRASLLAYTTPLWVMPLAVLFFQEKPSALKWVGFGLGLGGLIILLNPGQLDWSNPKILFGTAMLLLASLSWAISMLFTYHLRWNKSPFELIPWQLAIGTLPVVIYACIKEPHVTVAWEPAFVLSLVYMGMIVTGFSYWTGVVINKELPALIVSLGFLIVPIFSLTISAYFMHEAINLTTISAVGLILMGLVCVVI